MPGYFESVVAPITEATICRDCRTKCISLYYMFQSWFFFFLKEWLPVWKSIKTMSWKQRGDFSAAVRQVIIMIIIIFKGTWFYTEWAISAGDNTLITDISSGVTLSTVHMNVGFGVMRDEVGWGGTWVRASLQLKAEICECTAETQPPLTSLAMRFRASSSAVDLSFLVDLFRPVPWVPMFPQSPPKNPLLKKKKKTTHTAPPTARPIIRTEPWASCRVSCAAETVKGS